MTDPLTAAALTPEVLDDLSVRLLFALRDSLDTSQVSYLDFWSGRASTALETAAAGAETWAQAVTIAARKLQIDVLTPEASHAVTEIAAVLSDRAAVEAWSGHVARNVVYVVALATVARDERKAARTAKAAAKKAVQPTIPEEPQF